MSADRRKNPHPGPLPEGEGVPRRPNRAHGALDKLPDEMQLQVKDWYLAGCTYEQIANALAQEGYQASKSQIHRWFARKRNELERIERAKEKSAVIAKYLVPDGGEVEQSAVALAQAISLEALIDAQPMQVESIKDLALVARSIGRLQSSAVVRDKWEHEKRKKIEEAVAVLKNEIQVLLAGMPELAASLMDVVDAAKDRMLEKTA